jgi:hypothetical protein
MEKLRYSLVETCAATTYSIPSPVTAGMHMLLLVGNFDVYHIVNDSSCERKLSF